MIRVIVVDDSEIVRGVLRAMAAEIGGIELCGEFVSPAPAIASLRTDPADVVVLDIQLINGSGMEVMRAVSESQPGVKVIVFSNFADAVFRERYLGAGAYAFYDKKDDLRALRATLRQLAAASGEKRNAERQLNAVDPPGDARNGG